MLCLGSTLTVGCMRSHIRLCDLWCRKDLESIADAGPWVVMLPKLDRKKHLAKNARNAIFPYMHHQVHIQINVPAIHPSALPPNITPSSSPGTLSTSTLYDCENDNQIIHRRGDLPQSRAAGGGGDADELPSAHPLCMLPCAVRAHIAHRPVSTSSNVTNYCGHRGRTVRCAMSSPPSHAHCHHTRAPPRPSGGGRGQSTRGTHNRRTCTMQRAYHTLSAGPCVALRVPVHRGPPGLAALPPPPPQERGLQAWLQVSGECWAALWTGGWAAGLECRRGHSCPRAGPWIWTQTALEHHMEYSAHDVVAPPGGAVMKGKKNSECPIRPTMAAGV